MKEWQKLLVIALFRGRRQFSQINVDNHFYVRCIREKEKSELHVTTLPSPYLKKWYKWDLIIIKYKQGMKDPIHFRTTHVRGERKPVVTGQPNSRKKLSDNLPELNKSQSVTVTDQCNH